MKAILICPCERPAVSWLAESSPLAVVPMLGKGLVEYWLDYLVTLGVKDVRISASDRPDHVRAVVGDGSRWGLRVETIPENRELTVEEARAKYCSSCDPAETSSAMALLLEHPPGRPLLRLFESYEGWFAALQAWLPRALSPDRIGQSATSPGIWLGLRSRIAPTAELRAPCWIGDNVLIGPHAIVGPDAIIENDVIVEDGAQIVRSAVGPSTFVGELVSIEHSIACGRNLINWKTGSRLEVPDDFLLGSLEQRPAPALSTGWTGRLSAILAMAITLPVALPVILKRILRDKPIFNRRQALRPFANVRSSRQDTFAYYELRGASGWLRRWPQLWSIVRGDFTWIGNRPLGRSEVSALGSDFERLWLTAPIGLISLADAEYCREGVHEDSCAHSSYYAVRSSPRLKWSIFSRAIGRAVTSKILWQDHTRDLSVSLSTDRATT